MDYNENKYYGNPFRQAEMRYTSPWLYNEMMRNVIGYGGGLPNSSFLNPQLNGYLRVPMLAQRIYYGR